jgi:hypothetical protein
LLQLAAILGRIEMALGEADQAVVSDESGSTGIDTTRRGQGNVSRHPEVISGSLGYFETCPDWVPSLDAIATFDCMPACTKELTRFERIYAAKVRNVSSVGSQFKSFRFNAHPAEHASCRASPKPGLK